MCDKSLTNLLTSFKGTARSAQSKSLYSKTVQIADFWVSFRQILDEVVLQGCPKCMYSDAAKMSISLTVRDQDTA